MRRPRLLDYLLLISLALIWGSSFTLIKVVVPHLPPLSLTLWRVAVAAGMLLPAAYLLGERPRLSARGWGWVALAALTGSVLPFSLISWGEQHIDSGLAAIFISLTPIMVLVLAHFLTGEERLTPRRLLGVALGLAGVLVLMGTKSLAHLGENALRQLAVAAAALCYAVNTLVMRHLQMHHATSGKARKAMGDAADIPGAGPVSLAAFIMLASALMLAPFAFWREGLVVPPATTALWAAMLGVVHTALAALMMFAILRRAGAVFFATINFLIPVFGYLLGVLVLGEPVSGRALLALALVLAGIALASTDGHGGGEPGGKET